MKKVMLAVALCATGLLNAQIYVAPNDATEVKSQKSTVTVNVYLTEKFKVDYFKIDVTLNEYDFVGPNQESRLITIQELEKSFFDKLTELKVKKSGVELVSVTEIRGNNNYKKSLPQNRKLAKLYTFRLSNLEDVEAAYRILRINGIVIQGVNGELTPEKEIQYESVLTKKALEKARGKAGVISAESNHEIGEMVRCEDLNILGSQDYSSGYELHTNERYLLIRDISTVYRSIGIQVTFVIK